MNEIYEILILFINSGQDSKFSHIKKSDCQKDNVPTDRCKMSLKHMMPSSSENLTIILHTVWWLKISTQYYLYICVAHNNVTNSCAKYCNTLLN
jgi:hypothetical protein